MSKQYDNTNRGVLFKNNDKQDEKHADYRGHIDVDGVEFWLDAWLRTSSKDGSKFMSLSVKPKEPRGEKKAPAKKAAAFEDDDLLF